MCYTVFIIYGVFLKVQIYKFSPRGYMGSNAYLLVSGDEAAIIDPSVPFEQIKSALGAASLRYVLLTHCHFDHILKVSEYVEQTGAAVVIGEWDRCGLTSPIINGYRGFLGVEDGYFGRVTGLRDGDSIALGTEKIKVISTPGHTAGGVCYLTDGALFAGDTVFAGGGYGRCDLPGGDEALLFSSISRLCDLPDGIAVCSGHGEDTTIEEIKINFK